MQATGQHTVVNHSTKEVILSQHGERIDGLALGQEIGGLNALRTGQVVVELRTNPEVGRLPPFLHGNHDGEPAGQMRRSVQEVFALSQGFFHQFVSKAALALILRDDVIAADYSLVVVQFPHGLFQVANTTVDQFRTLTAGSGTEIITFDDSHLQSASGCVEGDTGAGRTGSDDDEIIFLRLLLGAPFQILDLLQARLDGGEAGRDEFAFMITWRRDCGGFRAGNVAGSVGDVEDTGSGRRRGRCVEQGSKELARMTRGHYTVYSAEGSRYEGEYSEALLDTNAGLSRLRELDGIEDGDATRWKTRKREGGVIVNIPCRCTESMSVMGNNAVEEPPKIKMGRSR